MPNYDDIIHLPHHQSTKRPHMPIADRAAQFSPFAALTGYDEAVRETARLTDRQVELSEEEKARLDETLHALAGELKQRPKVAITYFQPDEKKNGGAYVTAAGRLKKIMELERVMVLENGRKIPMDQVADIRRVVQSDEQEGDGGM